MNVTDIFRRTHYGLVAGPRDLTDREIARWVLAVCLHRDGCADAVVAADFILPGERAGSAAIFGTPLVDTEALRPSEQAALTVAVWMAMGDHIKWRAPRIAAAFCLPVHTVFRIIDEFAAEIRAGRVSKDFRAGLTDVSMAIREGLLEQVRG